LLAAHSVSLPSIQTQTPAADPAATLASAIAHDWHRQKRSLAAARSWPCRHFMHFTESSSPADLPLKSHACYGGRLSNAHSRPS